MPLITYAQERLILSVTPPLFQLNIGPGEFWSSTLRVINANSYDLTLFASVMNFESKGEGGSSKFIPIINEDPEVVAETLARWIEVSDEPISLARESSIEIPFSVRIPENAPPGGHYAAILVGTNPQEEKVGGPSVAVSSAVSSLFFVRISGDVHEEGKIKEFSTSQKFYSYTDVDFTLRFENIGNVHLQPQGEIKIIDMWKRERAVLPINQKTNFGNVLPRSTRKFNFSWKESLHPFDVGRYKALATISFGEDGKQTLFREVVFWIIPLKQLLVAIGVILFFMGVVWFLIRKYVKKIVRVHTSQMSNDSNYNVINTNKGHRPNKSIYVSDRNKNYSTSLLKRHKFIFKIMLISIVSITIFLLWNSYIEEYFIDVSDVLYYNLASPDSQSF